MDGQMEGLTDNITAQETPVPAALSSASALVSSSPQEGRWLSCPHLCLGLGGQKG